MCTTDFGVRYIIVDLIGIINKVGSAKYFSIFLMVKN